MKLPCLILLALAGNALALDHSSKIICTTLKPQGGKVQLTLGQNAKGTLEIVDVRTNVAKFANFKSGSNGDRTIISSKFTEGNKAPGTFSLHMVGRTFGRMTSIPEGWLTIEGKVNVSARDNSARIVGMANPVNYSTMAIQDGTKSVVNMYCETGTHRAQLNLSNVVVSNQRFNEKLFQPSQSDKSLRRSSGSIKK